MPVISEHGPSITITQIAALENELKAKLPEEYISFLLLNNGGRPEPDVIDIPDLPGTATDVQMFFGIGRAFESSDLFWNLALVAELCPEHHILPIASDSFGGTFCFSIVDGHTADVVFIDIPHEPETIYKVAPNFTMFLEKLRPFEE